MSTSIEWTDETWNPIRARLKEPVCCPDPADRALTILTSRWGYHCEKVSPGCKICYAKAMNGRTLPAWGTGLDYTVPNRDKIEIYLDKEVLLQPLHWKKPRMIFPCSMTDWCADFVTDEMRDRMLALCALTPRHTYQFLTKRAERMCSYISSMSARANKSFDDYDASIRVGARHCAECYPMHKTRWPRPNVWLGVSVENQQYADERIPHLLRTPAAVRWVSYEPALGPVDFTALGEGDQRGLNALTGEFCHYDEDTGDPCSHWDARIDWIVCGGESGPGARPMHPDWARSVRDQCVAAGVPFFFKQWGEWHPLSTTGGMQEVPFGHYVLPTGDSPGFGFSRVGKKAAGRVLDGREWNEMPKVRAA